jgi:hypothetical protein
MEITHGLRVVIELYMEITHGPMGLGPHAGAARGWAGGASGRAGRVGRAGRAGQAGGLGGGVSNRGALSSPSCKLHRILLRA